MRVFAIGLALATGCTVAVARHDALPGASVAGQPAADCYAIPTEPKRAECFRLASLRPVMATAPVSPAVPSSEPSRPPPTSASSLESRAAPSPAPTSTPEPESEPAPVPPPTITACAWVLFDVDGFVIAEGTNRVAIINGRVRFVGVPDPAALMPDRFLCRVDGQVVSVDGQTMQTAPTIERRRPTWTGPAPAPLPPPPSSAPHRVAPRSCPGGVTTTGRCCQSGCACGGSCIRCSLRCRH